jgi:hypothetical protein
VRSRLTALIIVAVLGIGVAAAIDALPEGDDDVSEPARSSGTGEAVTALRSAGVRGLITYSDEGCRLHAVRLPSLRTTGAPGITSCEPRFPTGGILAWEGDVVWSGLGFGTIQVVLPRGRIDRSVSRRFGVAGLALRARQAVSLGRQRYVVLVEGSAGERYLAFFETRRLLVAYELPEASRGDVLRPSPRGSYVAVLMRGRPGVSVFTRTGERVPLPRVPSPRTIAWSPDDNWTAVATFDSIYVFRSQEEAATLPRIPLAVRDLDWDALN